MAKKAQDSPSFADIAGEIAEKQDTDVLVYNGELRRPHDLTVIKQCKERKRRANVLLILVTFGGDAAAAYRVARCLQQKYERFTIFISGTCKSAGTLVAVGANEVILADEGELGPLDVQLMKADDLWETSSGLTIMNTFATLQIKSQEMFEQYALDLKGRSGGQITFKTAADIASKLTIGLFSPLYGKIEVMYVGDAGRAMNIARHYGERLNAKGNNLKAGMLNRLIASYSSHDFVIDRKEAQELFNKVREPDELEESLAQSMGDCARGPITKLNEEPIISFINDITGKTKQAKEKRDEQGGKKSEKPSETKKPTAVGTTAAPEPKPSAAGKTSKVAVISGKQN